MKNLNRFLRNTEVSASFRLWGRKKFQKAQI